MSVFDINPNASHYSFPYYFDDTSGITFREIQPYLYNLLIYYGDMNTSNCIDCICTRWNVDGYETIVTAILTKEQLQTLRENITPGAVGELYKILGRPKYYDQTWKGNNTLKLKPNPNPAKMSNRLSKLRDETIVFVKNITEHPLGDTQYLDVKIEGYVSGSRRV